MSPTPFLETLDKVHTSRNKAQPQLVHILYRVRSFNNNIYILFYLKVYGRFNFLTPGFYVLHIQRRP